jgi:hypothetical protein
MSSLQTDNDIAAFDAAAADTTATTCHQLGKIKRREGV